jgi:outer membrane protein, multidrug efflux system
MTSGRVFSGSGFGPALAAAAALALLAGCEVGPDYHRPAVPTPPAFAENGPWQAAAPKDTLPKANWWKLFADDDLDRLETAATTANPSVEAALARVDEARAVARVSLAALLPNLAVNTVGSRTRYSANRELPPGASPVGYTTNSLDLPLDLSYQIDVFGQVRRGYEAARALAEAQAAAYQTIVLSLQAEVAQDYYTLRTELSEKQILDRTVEGRRRELDLVTKRQAAGASDHLDVYRAEVELGDAQSAALAVDQRIAELRHALALLSGAAPESFAAPAAPLAGEPPAIPLGLPSDLLERRPDVAQAERTMAAVNAEVGVAKGAFFPEVGLNAFAGFNSTAFNSLFGSNSKEWSIAPFVSVPVFQGGRNLANYERAKAAYTEAAANYRGQVLVAFRDVDDSISDLRYLADQAAVLGASVTASHHAEDLSLLRYKQGVADYFEVIDAERTSLDNEVQFAQIQAQRFVATIQLVKALGGGW